MTSHSVLPFLGPNPATQALRLWQQCLRVPGKAQGLAYMPTSANLDTVDLD